MLRSDVEEDDDDEDGDESLRRGAVSWLADEALLLMAWVLLSTRDPKESLGVVSLVLCDRAGFCCALEICALAATSDVTPTTGDPLKTSSDQEVSKERANTSVCNFFKQNQRLDESEALRQPSENPAISAAPARIALSFRLPRLLHRNAAYIRGCSQPLSTGQAAPFGNLSVPGDRRCPGQRDRKSVV